MARSVKALQSEAHAVFFGKPYRLRIRGYGWRRPGRDAQEGGGVRIEIEFEPPGDSSALFRVLVAGTVVDDGLTAAQAHILVGEILERLTLPNGRGKGRVELTAKKR